MNNNNSTDLAAVEGRYIKGDPLNGYYDFIITEGSYKFWVVFQVKIYAFNQGNFKVQILHNFYNNGIEM